MKGTEKKFFDLFEIKERVLNYPDNFTYYPDITDSVLIELIRININIYGLFRGMYSDMAKINRNNLKDTILEHTITNYSMLEQKLKVEFKKQVQKVFKGGNK